MNDLTQALLNAQPNLAEGQSFERDFPKGLEQTEGYVPTNNPVSTSAGISAAAPISFGQVAPESRRWDVYANETDLFMHCGRVRIAGDEGNVTGVSISGNASSLTDLNSIADGDCVWLECTSKALAGLSLEYGTYPASTYAESGGNITRYSHAIGDITETDPGAGSVEIAVGNSTFYYRSRPGDCDLLAIQTTVFVDGNATHGVVIIP